jgi:hypothetical protein
MAIRVVLVAAAMAVASVVAVSRMERNDLIRGGSLAQGAVDASKFGHNGGWLLRSG